MKRCIMIVDDDTRVSSALRRGLSDENTDVRVADSGEQAIALLAEAKPEVVLSDVRMPGLSGVELLRLLQEHSPGIDVILMTAHDDLPLVATAMREGATDFLMKPLDLHQLRRLLERVYEDRAARARSRSTHRDDAASRPLVGRDPRMVEIFKTIGQVAASRTNVVVRGESGTGKELIARAIHESSPYAAEPFVAVNCTALAATLLESELFGHVRGSFTGASADRKGRFALAGRGSVFLDEIGDTPPDFQAKLLRVIQEREFYPVGADRPERTEARVIAATHRNLEKLVGSGQFREDLYYRLRVVEIVVPPLRERIADIPALTAHLIDKVSRAAGRSPPVLSRAALDLLLAHTWPGNVRELENTITRAVVMSTGDVIRPEHLALATVTQSSDVPLRLTTLEQLEHDHIVAVLRTTHGQKARAAKILGVSRPRLDRLLKKYDIKSPGLD
jgi:DNA-binding NtrC family response regulator